MISGKRLKLLFSLVDDYVNDEKVRKIMKKRIMEIVYLAKGSGNTPKGGREGAKRAPAGGDTRKPTAEEELRQQMSTITI